MQQRFPHAEKIIFETGFGPSGHPHTGTVGEVIRTHYVRMALAELGRAGEIVVFSDDMDGLRKVPANIEAPWLHEHLGKPVSQIPDPYGCCASFSAHMNNELHAMVQRAEVPYTFRSSAECYRQGLFDDALHRIFERLPAVMDLIVPTMREENSAGWHPFKPLCENCGRINTTQVEAHDLNRRTVTYCCGGEHQGVGGCGYRGEQSYLGGRGKMGWKVDWAVRWFTFGVHYEMYGKDLIESARLARDVLKVMGGKAPVDMFYELFLDHEGHKISKSVGRGFTFSDWERYGTAEALNLLMLKNPRQQKRLTPEVLVQYMDEALTMSAADPQYAFVYYRSERPDVAVRFSDLVSVVAAVGVTDLDVVRPYLVRYLGAAVDAHWDYLQGLLVRAGRYYEDFLLPQRAAPEFDAAQWQLIDRFVGLVEHESEPEAIQSGVFAIAREHDIAAKEYFKLLYRALLGQDFGPRIGSFAVLLGADKIKEIVAGLRGRTG